MTTQTEALKLALEALKTERDIYREHDEDGAPEYILDAIAALEALAQPEQEYDWKDLYEKEKRRSAMWLAKYEEVAGPAPKAYPVAQPEQEPVGMRWRWPGYAWVYVEEIRSNVAGNPEMELLYTTPPQRTWVGLTDEEIETIWHEDDNEDIPATLNEFICAVRVIEAKLKEKNNA